MTRVCELRKALAALPKAELSLATRDGVFEFDKHSSAPVRRHTIKLKG